MEHEAIVKTLCAHCWKHLHHIAEELEENGGFASPGEIDDMKDLVSTIWKLQSIK